MNIVYDVEISIRVKTNDNDNPRFHSLLISLPNTTYEIFSSIWPEVLYQAEASKKLLEMEEVNK